MARTKTWALVMNGTRARVLRGLENGVSDKTIELVSKAQSSHLRDILSDKSGRSFASDGSGRRSAMEPGSDPILRDMQEFAVDTIALLERHGRAGDFEKLAIFAAPRMLGILRRELPATLREKVILEEAANYVALPQTELRRTVLKQLKVQTMH